MRRRCWTASPISSQNHGWRWTNRAPPPAGLCWKRSVPTRSSSLPSTPRPTSPRSTMHCISAISSHRRRAAPDRLYRMRTWHAGSGRSTTFAPVWRHLSLMSECRERCERALLSLEPHVSANRPLRMELQIALASAIFITMGPPEQAKTLLTEALETADALNDPDARAEALSTLLAIYASRGEYGRARIAAERIEQIAHRIGNPIHLRVAYRLMGLTLLLSGKPREAQQYLERVLRFPAAPGDRHAVIYYNSNDHAVARAVLAQALWMQGLADQALNEARLSLKELQGTDHHLQLCRILYHGICRVATMTGDFATADREIARLIEVATSLNAPQWETAGHFLKGKVLVERGEF